MCATGKSEMGILRNREREMAQSGVHGVKRMFLMATMKTVMGGFGH